MSCWSFVEVCLSCRRHGRQHTRSKHLRKFARIGGEVAKKVNYLNQGGMVWTFKLPKQLASVE